MAAAAHAGPAAIRAEGTVRRRPARRARRRPDLAHALAHGGARAPATDTFGVGRALLVADAASFRQAGTCGAAASRSRRSTPTCRAACASCTTSTTRRTAHSSGAARRSAAATSGTTPTARAHGARGAGRTSLAARSTRARGASARAHGAPCAPSRPRASSSLAGGARAPVAGSRSHATAVGDDDGAGNETNDPKDAAQRMAHRHQYNRVRQPRTLAPGRTAACQASRSFMLPSVSAGVMAGHGASRAGSASATSSASSA